MSRFLRYLGLQAKRMAKAYKSIIAFTAALLIIASAAGYVMLVNKKDDESLKKVNIGIVGSREDEIISMGISLIKKTDTSKISIEFFECADEDEALRGMENAQLDAYVIIPPGFAESMVYGTNKKITYVMAKTGASMSSVLTKEVIEVLSNYIIETQIGATALCDYAQDLGYSNKQVIALDVDMSVDYISTIVAREELSEIKEIGLGGNISSIGYYVCGFGTFFLLLYGISCCTLHSNSGSALKKVLYSRGYNTLCQILGEYIPFMISALITLMLPALIAGVASSYLEFGIPETEYMIFADYIALPFRIIPAIFAVTALQFLIYELISGVINSVLVQFAVALILGYAGGCFYPIYFFPNIIRLITGILPTGAALNCFIGVFAASPDINATLICLLWGIALLALSVLARAANIRRDGNA